MSTFPAYLRHYMEERGMNQRQLAEAAGLKEATVSRYLNGQREPKVSTLLTLCSALEVTPNDLTGIYSEPGLAELEHEALAAIRRAKTELLEAERLIQKALKEVKT